MHLYKEYVDEYLDKGYSVIPDRLSTKMAAIKNWSDYCIKKPEKEEVKQWVTELEQRGSNIAVCLGEASGIIAIDFDCEDPDIIKVIEHLFPPSPVEKIGNKGWTRFYKYNGEATRIISHNGNVVFEVLSTNKKTTIPPSLLKNGNSYEWKGKSLAEVDPSELPDFPPMICSFIETKLKIAQPDIAYQNGKFTSVQAGRNNSLKSFVTKLINNNVPLDEAIQKMIKFDEENHDPPFLTDHREQRHTEKFTAAGRFYFSILSTINNSRFIKNETPLIPLVESAVNQTYMEEVVKGKSQTEETRKKSNPILPSAKGGVLGAIQDYILKNSFIKQPAFALSASLSLMGVLAGRKFQFEGVASNLYLLNVAPSGSGKDAPQQRVKDILIRIQGETLLGAGDYVSDASLMDSLASYPTRLDIIDEAGGLLRSVNQGGATFNNKMADILAELYTCSTSKFLGRATAEGVKGSCIRPNVNLLCSTTPTGFSEGVSYKSIEKGLMGRFLVFVGEGDRKAERIKKFSTLDDETISKLKYWLAFQPSNSGTSVGNISQEFYSLDSTEDASKELDIVFEKYDSLRQNTLHTDPLLPIISRLYQQTLKIAMIHAVSRTKLNEMPKVGKSDVVFATSVIEYYFVNIQNLLESDIYRSKTEENLIKMLKIIKSSGKVGISRRDLYRKTRYISKRDRQDVIEGLLEAGEITLQLINGKQMLRAEE